MGDRLKRFRGWREPTVLEQCEMRTIDQDPTAEAVLHELKDILNIQVEEKRNVKDVVLNARLGELAYKEMRSCILHEGRLGPGAHGVDFGAESDRGPTYLTGVFELRASIGFAPRYMLKVLRTCIEGFAREASPIDPTLTT